VGAAADGGALRFRLEAIALKAEGSRLRAESEEIEGEKMRR